MITVVQDGGGVPVQGIYDEFLLAFQPSRSAKYPEMRSTASRWAAQCI